MLNVSIVVPVYNEEEMIPLFLEEANKRFVDDDKYHYSILFVNDGSKDKTLEIFGTEHADGSFHPFHIYSMRQAIEEGFILDVLQNCMTYKTCFEIANSTPDNPEVPASKASKVIKNFQQLHPYNISQKAKIIVEALEKLQKRKSAEMAK